MLHVIGSNLRMVKFCMQHLWMLHDVVFVWPGSNLVPRAHVSFGQHQDMSSGIINFQNYDDWLLELCINSQ